MKHTRTRFALVRGGTLAAIAGLAILVACEARLPTSAEVQKMDVASAEKAAMQTTILDEKTAGKVVYTVDGVTVTAAEAHALAANRIASVHVMKGRTEAGKDTGIAYAYVNVKTGANGWKEVPDTMTFRTRVPEGKLQRERMMTNQKGAAPLLFVDGVRVPEDAFKKLSPGEIVSVEVLKGEAATLFSKDPAAVNGVIRVTTKAKK